MTEYERSLERIADRSLAQRKSAISPPPALPPRVHAPHTNHWQRIQAAMGTKWMPIEMIALKSGLQIDRVRNQFVQKKIRSQIELRGSARNGFEWRLK